MAAIETNQTQRFLQDFGIEVPVIGLPGLGWGTAALVAEVSEAGGLGVLNVAFMHPDEIETAVSEIRQRTAKPFALMLNAPKKNVLDSEKLRILDMALSPLREDLGLPSPRRPIVVPDFDAQFEKVLELNIPALGVRLGGLREPYMEELEARHIPVFGLASNLRDAKVLVSSGVQAVVAAGWSEAGLLSHEEISASQAGVDNLVLWGECARALKVPVIAGGSVMTAEHVQAAKLFGLSGLLLSDAFLCSDESAITPEWRIKLAYTADSSSEMSSQFFGREARFLSNGLSETLKENQLPTLQYPYQYFALKDIFDKGFDDGRIELALLETGQLAYLAQSKKVAEIVSQFKQFWE